MFFHYPEFVLLEFDGYSRGVDDTLRTSVKTHKMRGMSAGAVEAKAPHSTGGIVQSSKYLDLKADEVWPD